MDVQGNPPSYEDKSTRPLDPTALPPKYSTKSIKLNRSRRQNDRAGSLPPGYRDSRWSERESISSQDSAEHLFPYQTSPVQADRSLASGSSLPPLAFAGTNFCGSRKITRKKCFCILIFCICLVVGGIAGLVLHFIGSHKNDGFLYGNARPGTALTAVTHTLTGSPADQVYLVLHQTTNGDIHVTTILHDKWNVYKVTSDARNGTGLSAMVTDYLYAPLAMNASFALSLFYVDKNDTLQELRTEIADNSPGWKRGPLGAAGLRASSDFPFLESGYDDLNQFAADDTLICPNATQAAWLMYRPENDQAVQELFWDASTDSWHRGARFEGLKRGTDLVTMVTPLRPQSRPLPITRFLYGIGNDSQLQEWHCENCCVNTTDHWKKGNATTFPSLFDKDALSLAGQNKDTRLLYSKSSNGTLFSMADYRNVSNPLVTSPPPMSVLESMMVGPAMAGSKLAIARGPAENRLDMLVYQTKGTDVTVMYPKVWDRGPVEIPIDTQ